MTVQELARGDVVTVEPSESARDVAEVLRDEAVGSAVVTEGSDPVGIVTDRDLAVRVVARGRDPDSVEVGDVMTDDPATADASLGLYELVEKMAEEGVRRMPVTEDGALVGVITLDDLVRLLSDELGKLSEVIEFESPPY